MRYNIEELDENISKVLPDNASKYIFLRTYRESCEKGFDDNWASLHAWEALENHYDLSKMCRVNKGAGSGIYSSVKPNPHTAKLIADYIAENNIPNPVPQDKLHCTIIYSRDSFVGYQPKESITVVQPVGRPIGNGFSMENDAMPIYSIRRLGKNKEAICLCFMNMELEDQFWQALSLGASWDHMNHVLHITLSYDAPDYDISQMKLPEFAMTFEPEVVEAFDDDWVENMSKFEVMAQISKMDTENRIVYGWANVIEKNGEEIIDLAGDSISEQELLDAAHDFMLNYREGHEMHEGVSKGYIVESMVFTKALQKSLNVDLGQVGWFIAYKVDDEDTWEKVKKGEYTAFSIGGSAIREPVSDET